MLLVCGSGIAVLVPDTTVDGIGLMLPAGYDSGSVAPSCRRILAIGSWFASS
jgi:hypothetical protein